MKCPCNDNLKFLFGTPIFKQGK